MKPPQRPMSKGTSVFLFGFCALLLGCGVRMFLNTSVTVFDTHARAVLGGGGNSFVLLHGREAFLSDVKFLGYSGDLRRSVEEDLGHQIRRILLTHAHGDHAGGLGDFDPAVVLVHPNARRQLEAQGKKARWVEVEDELSLFLGGEEVQVRYVGVGHTDGDLVAYLPGRKLLVAGDLINKNLEPVIDATLGGDILKLVKTVDALMALDFETVVPGHGEVMTRSDARGLAAYLHALEAGVRAALAAGKTEEQTAQTVTVAEHPLEAMGFTGGREKNVRGMYRAVLAEGKRAP